MQSCLSVIRHVAKRRCHLACGKEMHLYAPMFCHLLFLVCLLKLISSVFLHYSKYNWTPFVLMYVLRIPNHNYLSVLHLWGSPAAMVADCRSANTWWEHWWVNKGSPLPCKTPGLLWFLLTIASQVFTGQDLRLLWSRPLQQKPGYQGCATVSCTGDGQKCCCTEKYFEGISALLRPIVKIAGVVAFPNDMLLFSVAGKPL